MLVNSGAKDFNRSFVPAIVHACNTGENKIIDFLISKGVNNFDQGTLIYYI